MRRLKELRKHVNAELDRMKDEEEKDAAFAHLSQVSLAAVMLAKKRGLDEELAAMAGLLHDLYAYKAGTYEDHAHKGAELAGAVLRKLALTTEEETEEICAAIYSHDEKAAVDGPMAELLKDADVISHTMNDPTKAVKDKERPRYERICGELGLNQAGREKGQG